MTITFFTFGQGFLGRFPSTLLALALVGVAGCSDLASVMRDEIALESERIDRITFVTDEASAKDYMKAFEQPARQKVEDITKKKAELVDNLEKPQRAVWERYEGWVSQYLRMGINPAYTYLRKNDENAHPVQDLYDRNLNILEALANALKDDNKFPTKEGAWEKILEGLPSNNVMARYMREKMALKIALRLQVVRLENHINNLEIGVEAADMKRVLDSIRSLNK